jgi:uridine kinase
MLIIGIAGGSGSGKTTVVRKIIERLPIGSVSLVLQDAYYFDNGHLSPEEKKLINFDHPDSIEWDLLVEQLASLKNGGAINMPTYSYVECARLAESVLVEPRSVIIVEGILIFTHKPLLDMMDIKVFVDAEADERLMRIIRRDTIERGRDVEAVLLHYQTYVKSMHEQFIEPSKRLADVIIPQGGENEVGIELLTSRIRMGLGSGIQ